MVLIDTIDHNEPPAVKNPDEATAIVNGRPPNKDADLAVVVPTYMWMSDE